MSECIHGLEAGRCDLCNPKPTPKVEAAPPKTARARKATPARSKLAAAPPHPVINVGQQRIYHVTHVRNLDSILTTGCLLADASDAWDSRPAVDISTADNREERRAASVDSETVAQYVPFFVTPDSMFWQGIRAGMVDPRISPDARHMPASDFVILVSTVDNAGRENAVIAAGDAADANTRFVIESELMGRELHRLHEHDDALRSAEFLVWDSFPFESVMLIGVANDKSRDQVKAILRSSTYQPKVAVHPPWFAKPE